MPPIHYSTDTHPDEKHLMEVLFANATIGIIVADVQGNIMMANPFLLEQFGYHPGELSGRPVETLIPMGAGRELFGLKKDGSEFPVEVSLSHYRNNKGNFVVIFVNNITTRKKAEQEIQQFTDALEQKVEERTHLLQDTLLKLQASQEELTRTLGKEKELNELKSRFVSMASHEFRTPLSTILSSAYLIQQYSTAEEQHKRQKHIDRVVSSVGTLTEILNDFLSVGKIEEGKIAVKYTSFNIKHQIQQILEEIRSIQKPGQTLQFEHTGPETVKLDATLLKHIVLNLVSNAIKFSPDHSTISVGSHWKSGQWILSVKDQGIGIPEEDQQHLFERFFRGSNVSNIQGTGLGLHIVRKYAQLMNGAIACKSQAHAGTEMTVSISMAVAGATPVTD